jgi:pimeloyl-ACP methyl ester carboxylesterase
MRQDCLVLRGHHVVGKRQVEGFQIEIAQACRFQQGIERRSVALDSESIARVFEALTVSDLTPRLPIYKSPTLILNDEHATALPGGTRTAGLLPHAEHRILARTGHCCLLEDPEGFEKLVREFLLRNDLWPRGSEMWAGGCSSRLPKRSALD